MVKTIKGLREIVLVGTVGLALFVSSGCQVASLVLQGVNLLLWTAPGKEAKVEEPNKEAYKPTASYEINPPETYK